MNKEFSMEEKIDILIETTAQIKGHLLAHDERFNRIDDRFDRLEGRFDGLSASLNKLVDVLESNETISSFEATKVAIPEPLS